MNTDIIRNKVNFRYVLMPVRYFQRARLFNQNNYKLIAAVVNQRIGKYYVWVHFPSEDKAANVQTRLINHQWISYLNIVSKDNICFFPFYILHFELFFYL